jgi:hypothetical protein
MPPVQAGPHPYSVDRTSAFGRRGRQHGACPRHGHAVHRALTRVSLLRARSRSAAVPAKRHRAAGLPRTRAGVRVPGVPAVELRRVELRTFSVRTRRATSCAIAPGRADRTWVHSRPVVFRHRPRRGPVHWTRLGRPVFVPHEHTGGDGSLSWRGARYRQDLTALHSTCCSDPRV